MTSCRVPSLFLSVLTVSIVQLTPSLPQSSLAAVPQTIVIDGANDFDVSNRIDNDSGDTQLRDWCPDDPEAESPMDLGGIFLTNDSNYLYFGFEFDPDCFRSQPPFLQLGIAIDAITASGGTDDPMGRQITWTGVSDRPDFCIYDALDFNNLEVLFEWDSGSSTWNAIQIGPNALQIFDLAQFVEGRIPLTTLDVSPGMPIQVEFWVSQNTSSSGPLDAACSDAVQLSQPGVTNFSPASPVPMACLIPYMIQNPAVVPMNRAQAISIVQAQVIQPSPYSGELVGFLYNRLAPDSLLHAGDTVSSFDSTTTDVMTGETYLFWLDNEPNAFFEHSSSIVYVDPLSGAVIVRPARSWPVVNGEQITRFMEEGNSSGERFHGTYETGTSDYMFTPETQPSTNQWAIIIGGVNLYGEADALAISEDARRAKEILNGAPLGPHLPCDNITGVGTGNGTATGATNDEILMAIMGLPQDCGKLWVFYVGHGKNGEMITKGADGKPSSLSYEDLAKKLIATGAKEFCIVIMACHSGSSTKPLGGTTVPGDDGKEIGLKGKVVTSSSSGSTTKREPDGSTFMKALLACYKDAAADLNKNGAIDLCEAHGWARAMNKTVAGEGATGALIGDGRRTSFPPPTTSREQRSNASGISLNYELYSVYYVVFKQDGKPDSVVCRPVLYIKNPAGVDNTSVYPVDIICKAGGVVIGTTRVPPLTIPGGGRRCIGDVDPRCRSFEVKRAVDKPLRGASPAGGEPIVDTISRTFAYSPGEHIFQEFPITGVVGEDWVASVEPVTGWAMTAGPAAFEMPAVLDTQVVEVTGDVPANATEGAVIQAYAANTATLDSLLITIHALLYDSLATPLTGTHRHKFIAAFDGLDAGPDTLDLENTLVHLRTSTACLVGEGENLRTHYSTLQADEGINYSCTVEGELDWQFSTLVNPMSGLRLESTMGAVFEGGVLSSNGDGLYLTGDQSTLSFQFFLVDSSAANGVVLDAVTNGLLRDVRIENSGLKDVVLTNSSSAELRDCVFDDGRMSVEAGSTLTRSWTTVFRLSTVSGDSIPGAMLTICDAQGDTVGVGPTATFGFSGPFVLRQYVREGLSTTDYTPHLVKIEIAGYDTTIAYEAESQAFVHIILPDSAVAGAGQEGNTPPAVILSQNRPNPFHSATSIQYALPEEAHVTLRVFNLQGQEIGILFEGRQAAGPHVVDWRPGKLPAGVYFYRLEAAGQVASRKLIRLE